MTKLKTKPRSKKRRPRISRIINPVMYQVDNQQPRFRLQVEWDGGVNVEVENKIKGMVRAYGGYIEGSGCFVAEPRRRDYSIVFNNRDSFVAVRDEITEVFNGVTISESETVLLSVEKPN